jgi:hypothetical protein
MTLGTVLDVTIGLAFTYLLLSIMVSGVQEIVAGRLSLRGKKLRDGIAELLAGGTAAGAGSSLFDRVFGHALISELATKKDKPPSYVPARNFSMALFEALKDGSQSPLFSQIERSIAALPDGAAKQSLTAFVTQAGGDIDALQKRVETWFDDGMDRVSGVYKRFSQYFTLVCGLVVAIVLNVDSIGLARTLWNDPMIRGALVKAAEQYQPDEATPPAAAATDKMKEARCILDSLPLPIGWRDTEKAKIACKAGDKPQDAIDVRGAAVLFYDRVFNADGSGLWLIVGWIITALAVSFGAPFWFAALQQLFNIRNAGPKPPRTEAGGGT